MRATFRHIHRSVSPQRLLVATFAAAIAIGAALLATPLANADGRWRLSVDALFLATSGVCVTGLDPVGIGTSLSGFGLCVLLLLVELGGLGIMTVGTFFFIALGRRLSHSEEDAIMNALGEGRVGNVPSIIRSTLVFTLLWEVVGTVLIAHRLRTAYGFAPGEAVWNGLFMSVMAFCNAGFGLLPDNMCRYARDPALLGVLLVLMIVGGLGFIVQANLVNFCFRRRQRPEGMRLSLHTYLVLTTTGLILLVGTLFLLVLEGRHAFAGFAFDDKLLNAFFQTATARTTGFAAVPTTALRPASILVTLVVMFIGAAPGSTGGGIKVTTAAVLFATVRDMLRNRQAAELRGRSLPRRVVVDAIAIAVLSLGVVGLACFGLALAEEGSGLTAISLVFEVVSAYTTTGLSLGATALLSVPGKLVIVACMFIGRLGPVALAMTMSRSRLGPGRRYPEETVIVG